MNVNNAKSKNELLEELASLRLQVDEYKKLEIRMAELEREHADLKSICDERTIELNRECAFRDQTEEALKMAQVIIDRSPVVLFRRIAGEDPRLVYVSNNVIQFGYTAEAFLNEEITFKDIVHPDDSERIGEEIMGYADDDVEEYTQYYRLISKTGEIHWVEDQTSVVRDDLGNKTHNQGILVDITERKTAEDKLRKSEEKFRRIVETAGEGFLLMDQHHAIIDVNEAYCQMLGYQREEILGKTPTDLAAPEDRQFMQLNKEKILSSEYRKFEGTMLAKDGRSIPVLIHSNTLRDDQGEVIGNMAFVTDMTEHKKALALAGEVQKSLLPQEKPKVQGLDIAGKNVSCDEIGGDYFDFLWRRENPGGPFTVVVGDITGHGVDSALLMTSARAFLRMRASQPGTISEIITAMNRHLSQDVLETGRFMTLFYLTIDHDNNQMDWVRAGHDPALIYDPVEDTFEELMGPGVALGLDEDLTYSQNHKIGINDGQIIAIGTDGIWEAMDNNGNMFGKERFRNIIRSNAASGADQILNAVFDDLNRFTQGHKSEDDITLVIIKVNKPNNSI